MDSSDEEQSALENTFDYSDVSNADRQLDDEVISVSSDDEACASTSNRTDDYKIRVRHFARLLEHPSQGDSGTSPDKCPLFPWQTRLMWTRPYKFSSSPKTKMHVFEPLTTPCHSRSENQVIAVNPNPKFYQFSSLSSNNSGHSFGGVPSLFLRSSTTEAEPAPKRARMEDSGAPVMVDSSCSTSDLTTNDLTNNNGDPQSTADDAAEENEVTEVVLSVGGFSHITKPVNFTDIEFLNIFDGYCRNLFIEQLCSDHFCKEKNVLNDDFKKILNRKKLQQVIQSYEWLKSTGYFKEALRYYIKRFSETGHREEILSLVDYGCSKDHDERFIFL